MQLALFLLFIAVIYPYLIYPIILGRFKPNNYAKLDIDFVDDSSAYLPYVDVILTCCEEGHKLDAKLANITEMCEGVEERITVVHDGCKSGCAQLPNVSNIRHLVNGKKGKEAAQWRGIRACDIDAEIFFFTDMSTTFKPRSMLRIVAPFDHRDIGAVSTEDQPSDVTSEYLSHEMWIRRIESQHAGLVGLSGSGFAVDATLVGKWDTKGPSDLLTALSVHLQGRVAVTSSVKGVYDVKTDGVYRRQVRTTLRGMNGLKHQTGWKKAKPLWMFQLISHKPMRWLSPWFLTAFVLVAVTYMPTMATIVSVGLLAVWWGNNPPNAAKQQVAVMEAGIRFLCGQEVTMWNPSRMDSSRDSFENPTIRHPNW